MRKIKKGIRRYTLGILGSTKFDKLKPKKLRASERIKNAKNAITNPTIEAMILPRALSTFALSPPDVIHEIPPQMRKKRAIRTAIIKMNVTAAPTIPPRLFAFKLQSLVN